MEESALARITKRLSSRYLESGDHERCKGIANDRAKQRCAENRNFFLNFAMLCNYGANAFLWN